MAIPQGQAAKRLQDILQGLEAQIEQLAEEASIKKAQIDLDSATKMSDLEQAKKVLAVRICRSGWFSGLINPRKRLTSSTPC